MQTLTTNVLDTVSGGASKSSEVTTALTGIKDSLSSLQNNQKNNSGGFDSTTMLMLMLTLGQKNNSGPTVVTAGAPAPAAHGPIVNISTRFGRRW